MDSEELLLKGLNKITKTNEFSVEEKIIVEDLSYLNRTANFIEDLKNQNRK